ncbi:MAG: RhuM family protein [Burkholderiaceae bacterium]
MLILYTTEDGKNQIQLRTKDQTVWLTQRDMAELFAVSTDNIGLHLKNIFEDAELSREATTEESSVVQIEGAREVQRPVTLYNLDAILAVGYRVRSPRGVQFRRWASTILKEYLHKGFVMDDERLKNPDGRPDHFDEMLARIRDIRASEKRFYQKVRDLFALSSDYDKTDQATQIFFASVQNLLIYAVAQKTAAELITARAKADDPHFGLLHWPGAQVRKADSGRLTHVHTGTLGKSADGAPRRERSTRSRKHMRATPYGQSPRRKAKGRTRTFKQQRHPHTVDPWHPDQMLPIAQGAVADPWRKRHRAFGAQRDYEDIAHGVARASLF